MSETLEGLSRDALKARCQAKDAEIAKLKAQIEHMMHENGAYYLAKELAAATSRADSLQAELARLKAPAVSAAGYLVPPPGPDQAEAEKLAERTPEERARQVNLALLMCHGISEQDAGFDTIIGLNDEGLKAIAKIIRIDREYELSRLRSSPAPAATATTSTDRGL